MTPTSPWLTRSRDQSRVSRESQKARPAVIFERHHQLHLDKDPRQTRAPVGSDCLERRTEGVRGEAKRFHKREPRHQVQTTMTTMTSKLGQGPKVLACPARPSSVCSPTAPFEAAVHLDCRVRKRQTTGSAPRLTHPRNPAGNET